MILFIFPPFSNPFGPALGPAFIKSYIENNSDITLKIYDQNIKFHQFLFNNLDSAHFEKIDFNREELKESIEWLKKKKIRPDQFRKYSNNFYKNTMKVYTYFDKKVIEYTKAKKYDQLDFIFKDIFQTIEKNQIKTICFSHLFNQQLFISLYLAKRLKQKHNVTTIFGGHPIGHDKENYIEKDQVDYIIFNDGEKSLLKLLKQLRENSKDMSQIPNLIWKENGQIKQNKSIKFDLNLQVNPNYDDLILSDYLSPEPVISLVLGRGCFWNKCSFCTSPINTDEFRIRTVETFVDEIELIQKKYGVNYFTFEDEMIIPPIMKKIANELIRRNLKIKYTFLAKPNKGDRWDFDLIKKSGCVNIYWGVETGNQKISDLMQKGTTIQEVKSTLQKAHDSGIINYAFIMFGFPGETKDSFMDTIEIINQEYIDSISVSTFGLQKDTDVYLHPEKYGIKVIRKSRTILADQYDFEYIELKNQLSKLELTKLKKEYSPKMNAKNKWTDKINLYRNHMLILNS